MTPEGQTFSSRSTATWVATACRAIPPLLLLHPYFRRRPGQRRQRPADQRAGSRVAARHLRRTGIGRSLSGVRPGRHRRDDLDGTRPCRDRRGRRHRQRHQNGRPSVRGSMGPAGLRGRRRRGNARRRCLGAGVPFAKRGRGGTSGPYYVWPLVNGRVRRFRAACRPLPQQGGPVDPSRSGPGAWRRPAPARLRRACRS